MNEISILSATLVALRMLAFNKLYRIWVRER